MNGLRPSPLTASRNDKNVIALNCRPAPHASILNRVVRRILQLAIAAVLLLATLTPLLELCDSWDKGVVPANDTELSVTAAFSCVGLLVTVTMLARWKPRATPAARHSTDPVNPRQPQFPTTSEPIEPTGSPPLLLPLRI